MAIRFSKRIKLAPGLNLNLSKRGIGTSAGPKGLKLGLNRKGTYVSGGIPGTGIYAQKYVGKKSKGLSGTKSNSLGCLVVLGLMIFLGFLAQYPFIVLTVGCLAMLTLLLYKLIKRTRVTSKNAESPHTDVLEETIHD